MTATFNLKVPLGVSPTATQKKPNYGLTVGFNHRLDSLTPDGRAVTHQAKLADIRFHDGFKLFKAEVATFDLANLDKDPRLNLGPEGSMDDTTWIVVGLVAAGIAVCLLTECIGDDDDDDDEDEDDEGSSSGS